MHLPVARYNVRCVFECVCVRYLNKVGLNVTRCCLHKTAEARQTGLCILNLGRHVYVHCPLIAAAKHVRRGARVFTSVCLYVCLLTALARHYSKTTDELFSL